MYGTPSPLTAQPLTRAVLHDTAEGQQRGFQGPFHERYPVHGGQVAPGTFNHIPDRLPLRYLLLHHQERVGLGMGSFLLCVFVIVVGRVLRVCFLSVGFVVSLGFGFYVLLSVACSLVSLLFFRG